MRIRRLNPFIPGCAARTWRFWTRETPWAWRRPPRPEKKRGESKEIRVFFEEFRRRWRRHRIKFTFHGGEKRKWVSCPQLSPRLSILVSTFGHPQFYRVMLFENGKSVVPVAAAVIINKQLELKCFIDVQSSLVLESTTQLSLSLSLIPEVSE